MGGRASSLSTLFFFSSRSRHTRCSRDWSSDVCSSDLRRHSRHFVSRKRGPPVTGRVGRGRGATIGRRKESGFCHSIRPALCTNRRAQNGNRPKNHAALHQDRKSTRLNSSHGYISYVVFCLNKKNSSI